MPELASLCACLAEGIPDEPGGISAAQICAVDTAMFAIEAYIADGQSCIDAFPPAWGCLAAACMDPDCDIEPPPDSCLCAAQEAAVGANCPNF